MNKEERVKNLESELEILIRQTVNTKPEDRKELLRVIKSKAEAYYLATGKYYINKKVIHAPYEDD